MIGAVYVARTRFQTLNADGTVAWTTYGARIYNDIENAYVNHLDSLEELTALDAGELLDHIKDYNATADHMITAALSCGIPVYVDEERYHKRRSRGGR